MSFEYSLANDVAVDAARGLTVKQDLGFRETPDVYLRLTDEASGQSWPFPVSVASQSVTYETTAGPRTERMSVGGALSRQRMEPLFEGLKAARREAGQPLYDAEVKDIVTEAVRTFFLRGEIMLKFIPDFQVTWT